MRIHIYNYRDYLKNVKNVSDNTISSYESDLNRLVCFLEEQNIDSFEKMNETVLNSYVLYLEKIHLSEATIARSLSSLKKFVYYLITHGVIKEDPTERMKAPKVMKKPVKFLTTKEVENLLSAPDVLKWPGKRDKAMLELMYATKR